MTTLRCVPDHSLITLANPTFVVTSFLFFPFYVSKFGSSLGVTHARQSNDNQNLDSGRFLFLFLGFKRKMSLYDKWFVAWNFWPISKLRPNQVRLFTRASTKEFTRWIFNASTLIVKFIQFGAERGGRRVKRIDDLGKWIHLGWCFHVFSASGKCVTQDLRQDVHYVCIFLWLLSASCGVFVINCAVRHGPHATNDSEVYTLTILCMVNCVNSRCKVWPRAEFVIWAGVLHFERDFGLGYHFFR